MELSLTRLRMLRELRRRGTVTAAAAALHYTASAVSQQLAQLERDVGATLFERLGRRVQLTDLGEVLAEHAEEILAAAERATMAVEEAQRTVSVTLTAGVWASVTSGLLPTALTALAAEHPGIRVRTRELAPEDTAGAVRDGTLDFSFVIDYSYPPRASSVGPSIPGYSTFPTTAEASLARIVIAVERLHAAVPAGAVPGAAVALSALAEHPWILAGPRSHFGRAVRTACHAAGFEPVVDHEVGEQATALAMVAAGLGVTLVSDLGLTLRPPGIDVVALTEPVTRTVSVTYRTGHERRRSLQVVIDAVRAAAAQKGLGARSPEPTAGMAG